MKMIILGAGATAYSYYANPERRPPLSKVEDFVRMFINPVIIRPAIQSCYKPFFIEAIKLYNGDIENLFTDLYFLAYPKLFEQCDLYLENINKLKELGSKLGNDFAITYRNALTIFTGALFDEIRSCIGTSGMSPIMPREMPICKWHRIIANKLNKFDIVVNFNYDSIMSYALLNERKLSNNSFPNVYLKNVDLKRELISKNNVILLTPHGSFTWYSHFSAQGELDNTVISINVVPPDNCSMYGVILPLKTKDVIMQENPCFMEEYRLFLEYMKLVEEIWVIGKQFKTVDNEIADHIKNITKKSNQKHIVFVNPDANDPEWVKYHRDIFNAKSHASFTTLKDYAGYLNCRVNTSI